MNTNMDLNGILLVDKPQGFTSFDVIAKLRGILRIKRLGHSGTLDPMATGVLPVLIGKATKASDILPVDEKSYIAGFKLGMVTDTQDITGESLFQSDKPISFEKLQSIVKDFEGDILQLPPMYSAVSVGGKRLYELAREGKTVEREPRQRKVNYIKIISYDPSVREGTVEVSVSKGTYIRTLIHDIGNKLECGGVMTSLRRISASGYDIDRCYTLEQIQQYSDKDSLEQAVIPVETAFRNTYRSIKLNRHCSKLYKNGVKLRLEQVGLYNLDKDETVCVFDYDSFFLGLAKTDIEKNEFKVYKNFF